ARMVTGTSVSTVATSGSMVRAATFSCGKIVRTILVSVSEPPVARQNIGMPDEDLAAAQTLRRATLRLSRRLQAERDEHGLSLTKISVLGHLARKGPLSAGALAAADRLKPQSLTRVLAD